MFCPCPGAQSIMSNALTHNSDSAISSSGRRDVSIVIPCFNEAGNIDFVLNELRDCLGRIPGLDSEVIAVDDGSNDGTIDILRSSKKAMPSLRIVRLSRNSGQSAAFTAGFRHATGRWIVTMDADGQNDPADIQQLLDNPGECSCVCGYREHRQDRWSKRTASRIANVIRNMILGEDIRDSGCSLKAFDARFVKGLQPWNGMHRFLPALVRMQGGTVRQVPVNHRPRRSGCSKYTNLGRLWRTLSDLRGVRWLQRRALIVNAEVDA